MALIYTFIFYTQHILYLYVQSLGYWHSHKKEICDIKYLYRQVHFISYIIKKVVNRTQYFHIYWFQNSVESNKTADFWYPVNHTQNSPSADFRFFLNLLQALKHIYILYVIMPEEGRSAVALSQKVALMPEKLKPMNNRFINRENVNN